MGEQTRPSILAGLWMLAAFIPFVCVYVGDSWCSRATGRPELSSVAPGTLAFHALLAASPFVVLAGLASIKLRAADETRGTAWLIAAACGAAVTLGLWGLFHYEAYVYWAEDRRTGANIGLGALMLASPLLVGCAMGLGYRIARSIARRRSARPAQ
jgi:hypothetical protein